MRKHLTAVLLGSGAAALALGIGTTAMATTATTWTIKPGGNVTGAAGTTKLTDTGTGAVLTCTSSNTVAKLDKGSGQTNPIGKITSVTFKGAGPGGQCLGPGGLAFTPTTSASSTHPWKLNATSFNSGTGVTKGKITGVTATLSGSGCTATEAGTSATKPGTVTGTYTNSSDILKVSGGNLHIWNVSSGCLNIVKTGDATTFVGNYKITPGQTITSP
jgi:hypothetical protein